MDHLTEVLRHIARCLRPGGKFVFSVVTEKFIEWTTVPLFLRVLGDLERAKSVHTSCLEYHHIANVFSSEEWARQLSEADLLVEEYIPIVPELTARLFLFLDHLWHIPHRDGEVGDPLSAIFATWPSFDLEIEEVLRGFLHMERDWTTCGGAVFYA